MLLVEDQYVQNSRKIFDTDLRLKQDTSKPVFSEHKEIWEGGSGCEEEGVTSGNDSEGRGEGRVLFADQADFPEETVEPKSRRHRKKNVRFEGADLSYVLDTSESSSLENEYLDLECGYPDPGHRRSLSLEPEIGHKVRGHFRVPKSKWRTIECGHEKKFGCERRPKSTPERSSAHLDNGRRLVGERKEHRCGRSYHGDFDFDDFACRKPIHRCKFECGDDSAMRHCDRHLLDEGRMNKRFVRMKPMSLSSHKHTYDEGKSHRKVRLDSHYDSLADDRYCQMEDYYDHLSSKTKKKILEAVEEQQEQFSDSTYKIPCSKYSSHTIPGEFQGKRSLEKLTNSSQSDWLYCGGKGGTLPEVLHEAPARIHKVRSRRTRMNRIKNGWKKAFVQTVRDGSRNERVGVIVMGSKGPEFYSKKPPGPVPFRKSKSFLDGGAKSFEVMTIDCKNVFLSSSEPGPRTNYVGNELVCPEDDSKMEEKMAKFSKNINDIVKSSEEKFYKSLSSNDYHEGKKMVEGMLKGAGEGTQQVEKKGAILDRQQQDGKSIGEAIKAKYPLRMSPFNPNSPRLPMTLRRPEKKFNQESKAMADALNEQAKQYRERQANREERLLEELKELEEKFPPKETSQEKTQSNLPLWMSGSKEEEKVTVEEGKKEEAGKDELSQTGSAKSSEQISMNKQRRKKYYEATTSAKTQEAKQEDGGEASSSMAKRVSKLAQWTGSPNASFEGGAQQEVNPIPASFRDLVENGCAISPGESANLQSILARAEVCSNGLLSSSSSDAQNKVNVSPGSSATPSFMEEMKKSQKEYILEKEGEPGTSIKEEEESQLGRKKPEATASRKTLRIKNLFENSRSENKSKEGKVKKKTSLENKMKLLREALPSIAAENEAAHLKQLKKYIDRFIDRASSSSEFRKRKEIREKAKDSASTDSSEVKVDARKILDFVSNPFKKISSDVTINIAKKLTDALVQEKSSRAPRKSRRISEIETDREVLPCGASSGSEPFPEPEPTYLKQLKKMRNEHLNNILLEVRRLSELLRFLDRCNRLHM